MSCYFWPILTPPSLCHTLSHIPGPPRKYVTHLGSLPPRFLVGLVQKTRTKAPCTNSLSIVRTEFCLGDFVRGSFGYYYSMSPPVLQHRGCFCPFPLLSEYICYSRKLNTTQNFMF